MAGIKVSEYDAGFDHGVEEATQDGWTPSMLRRYEELCGSPNGLYDAGHRAGLRSVVYGDKPKATREEVDRARQARALIDSGLLGDVAVTEATADRLAELYRLGLLSVEVEGVDMDPDGGVL